jgi:hypothetical protein
MGLDLSYGYGSWSYSRYDDFIAKVGKVYGVIPNKREDKGWFEEGMYGHLKDERFIYPEEINIPSCIKFLLEHANYDGRIEFDMCCEIQKELYNQREHFVDPNGYEGWDGNYRQFMFSLEEAITMNDALDYC